MSHSFSSLLHLQPASITRRPITRQLIDILFISRLRIYVRPTLHIRQSVRNWNNDITTFLDGNTILSTARTSSYAVLVWTIHISVLSLLESPWRRNLDVTYCFPLPPDGAPGVTALLKCIQYHSLPTFQLPLASSFLKPEPLGLFMHCCRMFSNASQLPRCQKSLRAITRSRVSPVLVFTGGVIALKLYI
jgi:hypothetical protein